MDYRLIMQYVYLRELLTGPFICSPGAQYQPETMTGDLTLPGESAPGLTSMGTDTVRPATVEPVISMVR